MAANGNLVQVEGNYVTETRGAVLIDVEMEEVWIPKSLIDNLDEIEGSVIGEPICIIIPQWKADEECLPYSY